MNERMNELAEQAKELAEQAFREDNAKRFTVMEKFAELIVKECAHLVGGYTKENEFGTDVKEAYEEITKHFGVE